MLRLPPPVPRRSVTPSAYDRIEVFPERGRPGKQRETRELTTVWPYGIVCRTKAETLEIIQIWHGRQNRGRPYCA